MKKHFQHLVIIISIFTLCGCLVKNFVLLGNVGFKKNGAYISEISLKENDVLDIDLVIKGSPANTANFQFSVSSNNEQLLPIDNIEISGSGKFRTIKITLVTNQTGEVTLTGTVNNTATGENATADLLIKVYYDPLIHPVPFTAWVGANDTEAYFSLTYDGFEFYRSSENNCDITNYASCSNGQMDILNNSAVIDSANTLTRTGYYKLKFEDNVSDAATMTHSLPFKARMSHQAVVFQNKIYVIGGYASEIIDQTIVGSITNDVWSSSDGINWLEDTANAGFSARQMHQTVVFNDKLWVIGGWDGTCHNDIWSSSDGINWVEEKANAEFAPQYGHQILVFNGQLWLISGGCNGPVNTNEIWNSTDGINWTRAVASAPFGGRQYGKAIVFHNSLWFIAGIKGGYKKNDVWSSDDGINWTQETADAGFTPRYLPALAIYNDKMWVIAGGLTSDTDTANDVWSSSDGVNWSQEASSAEFSSRSEHQAITFKNKIMIIGGRNGSSYKDDIWSSTNGASWRQGNIGWLSFP